LGLGAGLTPCAGFIAIRRADTEEVGNGARERADIDRSGYPLAPDVLLPGQRQGHQAFDNGSDARIACKLVTYTVSLNR